MDLSKVPPPLDVVLDGPPGPGVLAHMRKQGPAKDSRGARTGGCPTSDTPACVKPNTKPPTKPVFMQAVRAFTLGAQPCPSKACFAELKAGAA